MNKMARQRKGKRNRQALKSVKSVVISNLSNPIRPLFKRVSEPMIAKGYTGPRFYDPIVVSVERVKIPKPSINEEKGDLILVGKHAGFRRNPRTGVYSR